MSTTPPPKIVETPPPIKRKTQKNRNTTPVTVTRVDESRVDESKYFKRIQDDDFEHLIPNPINLNKWRARKSEIDINAIEEDAKNNPWGGRKTRKRKKKNRKSKKKRG